MGSEYVINVCTTKHHVPTRISLIIIFMKIKKKIKKHALFWLPKYQYFNVDVDIQLSSVPIVVVTRSEKCTELLAALKS